MALNVPKDRDKFIIRLPHGMRDRIAVAAALHKRSMTAEIVSRLGASLEADDEAGVPEFTTGLRIDKLENEVTAIKQRLNLLERKK